jgi:hypothetical protein
MDLYDAYTDYISVFPNGFTTNIEKCLITTDTNEILDMYDMIINSVVINNAKLDNLVSLIINEIKYRLSIRLNINIHQ